MATKTDNDKRVTTGLPKTDENNPRFHFDIYAILEGSQELYLGHEVQVNVNMVETIELQTKDGNSIKKCYISPTKRRGIERRCLIWSPVKSGELLGDKLGCGIPKTCTKTDCPICMTYGGLDPGKSTLIGRLTHGGGVAIQELDPVEKQRAMHPSKLVNKNEETPIPFKREYNQPGIFYPVYNHVLSVTEKEFSAVAYAFLDALPRMGAGNPKGVSIAEENQIPLLVLDRYLVPGGKRPIISPSETNPETAIQEFLRLANDQNENIKETHFKRWIGNEALTKLQEYSCQFVDTYLQE